MAIRTMCAMRATPLTRRVVLPSARTFQIRATSETNTDGTDSKAAVEQNQLETKTVNVAPGRRSRLPSLYSGFFPSRVSNMFRQMEEEMNQLVQGFGTDMELSSPFDKALTGTGGGILAVDVQDRDTEYVINADLPGIPKDQIKITVSPDNVLTISGERKQESSSQEGDFTRVERAYGSFQRSFKLPEHVDASGIKAKSDHGVLTLTVPKVEKEEPSVVTVNVE